ncbi:class I SAM-dependent methyltransferase [Synechococcus bigranulatus str. 'Rupite']|uniref:Class I SAM-dependent methyltransferase n=2 Tax=Thermostichus vulcanus TaxID=32053 RepID=A0ABT0CA93_THEVL|nr:class I SAM-dependent methyltransferase [Thermostichus vulcanus str. 'Rupite']
MINALAAMTETLTPPLSVEPIDWFARWRDRVEAREAQNVRWQSPRMGDLGFWAVAAPRFARMTRNLPTTDPFVQAMRVRVQPDDVILDIGAGAGRYSLPIAPWVKQVIALDPSPEMLQQLQLIAAEQGSPNIQTLQGSWPEALADLPPVDGVICAHAFYWVREMEPYLQALKTATGRFCLMQIRTHQIDAFLDPLFLRLHGESRPPEPVFLDLYGALTQVGIWADVQIAKGSSRSYPEVEELTEFATALLCWRPELASVLSREEIHAYLEGILEYRDGRYWLNDQANQMAMVSWQKG